MAGNYLFVFLLMDISVIVPTYKRNDFLQRVLGSLGEQLPPQGRWEILVVDNANSADTHKLVCNFKSIVIPIYYIAEPKLGLNNARNAGVMHAHGDLIAFLDDDSLPNKDWVRSIEEEFSKLADASCIGGKVEPLWETVPPLWLSDRFVARLTSLDLATSACQIRFPQYICGANMCYRSRVFKTVGLFAIDLDRRGKHLLSSGEVELCLRLERNGGTIYYSPNMIVKHTVSTIRTKRFYLLKRGYWQAVSDAFIDARHYSLSRCISKLRGRFADIYHQIPRFVDALVARDDREIMIIIDKVIFTLGYIHGVSSAVLRREA